MLPVPFERRERLVFAPVVWIVLEPALPRLMVVPLTVRLEAIVNAPAEVKALLVLKKLMSPVPVLWIVSVLAPEAFNVNAEEPRTLFPARVRVELFTESPLMVFTTPALIMPARVRLPVEVSLLDAEKKLMSPVVELPSCRVWKFVVPSTPLPVRVVAPVAASPEEIVAVGVPAPVLLMKANLELLVAVPPRSRSSVMLRGERAPRFLWKY